MNVQDILGKIFDAALDSGAAGVFADLGLVTIGLGTVEISTKAYDDLKRDVLFWFGIIIMAAGFLDVLRRLPSLPTKPRR